MNSDKLSARLLTVAKHVPQGARLADIGSDHAYLPCYLAKNNQISFGVAGEVASGPYKLAEKNVLSEGLSEKISVRMGDGLEVIQPDEVDCITIAGMGGSLITSILEEGKDKLDRVKRLILQPNISAITIRKWFLENEWELIAEEIVEEDGKIYEILVAEKGDARKPYTKNKEMRLLMGPYLLREKNTAFIKKWAAEKENWQRISKQLGMASHTQESLEKREELLHKMQLVEEAFKNEES